MGKPLKYKTCPTCHGEGFLKPVDNRHPLCPQCSGGGCVWVQERPHRQIKLSKEITDEALYSGWEINDKALNSLADDILNSIDKNPSTIDGAEEWKLSWKLIHPFHPLPINPINCRGGMTPPKPKKSISLYRKIVNHIKSKFIRRIRNAK